MLKRVLFAVLIFALLGLMACLVATAYNPSPDQVVVRLGFAYRGGPPREGQTCRYPDVPEILVWGDGLAYYRAVITSSKGKVESRWGRLSRVEMQELIAGLWLQGLFTDFEVGAANPAGDAHDFSVQVLLFSSHWDLATNLPARSGARRAYEWLVGYLSSKLAVFGPGTSGEPRIDQLNTDRECSS